GPRPMPCSAVRGSSDYRSVPDLSRRGRDVGARPPPVLPSRGPSPGTRTPWGAEWTARAPSVAPGGILGGHPHNQGRDLLHDPWTAWPRRRERPLPGDQLPVPSQTFSGLMSSDFFRALPQLLPRHRRQVVLLVIRHLAFPQDEDDLHPLRTQCSEGLAMGVTARPLRVVVRPGPLARAQREKGHLIHHVPEALVAREAEVDD